MNGILGRSYSLKISLSVGILIHAPCDRNVGLRGRVSLHRCYLSGLSREGKDIYMLLVLALPMVTPCRSTDRTLLG
jgi:hypothetical protein